MSHRATARIILDDPAAQAAEYRAEADREYKRGRADARRAAEFYQTAGNRLVHAAWLTRRPDLWDNTMGTPAQWERDAASMTGVADPGPLTAT